MEELLTRCLVVAGRSTHNARCILIEEGYPAPEALWDDVRAAGISLFINRSNGGK